MGSATFGDLVVQVDMLEVIQAGQGVSGDIKVSLEGSSIFSRGGGSRGISLQGKMLTKKAQHPEGSGLGNTVLPVLGRASLTNGSQHGCRVGAAGNALAYPGYTWVFRPVWTSHTF